MVEDCNSVAYKKRTRAGAVQTIMRIHLDSRFSLRCQQGAEKGRAFAPQKEKRRHVKGTLSLACQRCSLLFVQKNRGRNAREFLSGPQFRQLLPE